MVKIHNLKSFQESKLIRLCIEDFTKEHFTIWFDGKNDLKQFIQQLREELTRDDSTIPPLNTD